MNTKSVPSEVQSKIQNAYRALMAQGGKRRHGQMVMIGAIAKAACNYKKYGEEATGARLMAVQAPTGTGKTYAYGLGALPVAHAAGIKTIISTGTVQLQEQIMDKDLVTLKSVIPEMNAVLVKGRGRYACTIRTAEIARGQGIGEDAEMRALAQGFDADLTSGAWSGDVDDLQKQPDGKVWSSFTNDSNGCAGRKCSKYDSCPFYAARKKMEGATVFAVNHDLLLADIQNGNHILPKIEDCIIIIDEAHDLPNKALSSLEGRSALKESATMAMRAVRVLSTVRAMEKNSELGAQSAVAIDALQTLSGCIGEAQFALNNTGKTSSVRDASKAIRFAMGALPDWLAKVSLDCKEWSEKAQKAVGLTLEMISGEEGEHLPQQTLQKLLSDIGRIKGRLDAVVAVWHLMTLSEIDGEPVAKWVEIDEKHDDLKICASPVGVGSYLHELIWSKCAASIHLSATMMTVGNFENYLSESGLGMTADVVTLEVESPFDYQNQASLCVPRGMTNPKDTLRHTADVQTRTRNLIATQAEGTGSLFVFTSWKQLNEVLSAMPEDVRKHILAQGSGLSKREIIERHKAAIDTGFKSVIFGTASFEQGVDLQGAYCELVVISKLPFAVPTNPVAEARQEYLESQGKSFFNEVVIPETCRRLAQTTGRLIRSESDHGQVIVMDPRLTGTSYGRSMLKSLPAYRMAS